MPPRFANNFTIIILLILTLSLLGVWWFSLATRDPGSLAQEAGKPRPFDPLTIAEIRQAETLARQDATVQKYLDASSRAQLILIERLDVGDKDLAVDPKTPRQARIVFYVYDRGQTPVDETLDILVNLGAQQVVEVKRLTDSRPPIAQAEMEAARIIALRDAAVTTTLARLNLSAQGVRVNALHYRTPSDKAPCATNRCLEIFLTSPGASVPLRAIVNLTRQTVEWVDNR